MYHRAHGFRPPTAARSGDAGDADAVDRAEALPRAARERDRHRLGHLAVLADELRIEIERRDQPHVAF